MKRTAEISMSLIAAGLNVLAMLSGFRFLGINQGAIRQTIAVADTKQDFTDAEVQAFVLFVHFLGQSLIFLSVVSIILAVIGLIFLFKQVKVKAAGWLFIVAGILSLPELVIPGVLYLIAGLMALLRKAPEQTV
ncbi:DUF4064 domain-containing protein [Sporolactobacillus sp. Y61]|uniref:DUF4064 domain-containing protein n=1 Tax=Sporolactobacillus sp. Y61 TaxID=3160863 RepID=A0AAU8IE01_9BACL